MAPTSEHVDSSSADRASAADRQHSLNSQVRVLLLECSTREQLMERVLTLCRQQFGSSIERCDLLVAGSPQIRLAHRDETAAGVAQKFSDDFLAPLSELVRSGTDPQPRLKQLRHGEQNMALVAVPIMDIAGNQIEGAVSLLIGGQPRPELVLPRLDGVAAVISAVLAVLGDSSESPRDESPDVSDHVAADSRSATDEHTRPQREAEAVVRASAFTTTKEFAYSIVNSLRDQLQAEQVFFGVEHRQRIQVEAVSGIADFKASSPGVVLVRQAMEECIDAGGAVVSQSQKLSATDELPIHRQWAAACHGACVCSLPLTAANGVAGVLSLRRPGDQPWTADELAILEEKLTPYGAALRLIQKANVSAGQMVATAMRDSARASLSRTRSGRLLITGLLAVAALWFLFGTMTYRPLCLAKVTAVDLQHVAAPLNGQLRAVHVTPGQTVRQGELLLEFDTTDLRLQLNQLVRDIAAGEVRLREAISQDDLSLAAVARSESGVLRARAASVQRQIEDARIVAPRDGTVILADLEQRVGQEFSQGDEVLQFAAGEDWLLEIEVPDDIVRYISVEHAGAFAAVAHPTDRQPFRIQHIDGSATTRSERNVFMATAAMTSRPPWIRSGMEGTARITADSRPVWWVALHRVVDWARTSFWI